MAVIGWDVGGVHLKGARIEGGVVTAAVQHPAHLGYGVDRLEQAFVAAQAELGQAERHAVTMTGELADIFASRAAGVAALAQVAVRALAPATVLLYAGRDGFVAVDAAASHALAIASANWHATAAIVAGRCRDALLIDVGSTTTDVVPVVAGAVAARGHTDAERLAAGELVYTGLVRSHVLAVAQRAPVAGRWTGLMNEIFADMGDVHRLLGRLDASLDQLPSADGADKSVAASWTRLARMVAAEPDAMGEPARRDLARWFAEHQVRAVHDAAMLVLSGAALPENAPVVVAGIGTALVVELARRLNRPHVGFDALLGESGAAGLAAAHFAPAAAVALLLWRGACATPP